MSRANMCSRHTNIIISKIIVLNYKYMKKINQKHPHELEGLLCALPINWVVPRRRPGARFTKKTYNNFYPKFLVK